MLLHTIRDRTSYKDLRIVNGISYETYKDTCAALGLLDDDNEWDNALSEDSVWAAGNRLHNMSCDIVMFCEVIDANELRNKHQPSLLDDLEVRARRLTGDPLLSLSKNELALIEIELTLIRKGRSLTEFSTINYNGCNTSSIIDNKLLREEMSYNIEALQIEFQSLHFRRNEEQKNIFERLVVR